MCIYVHAHVHVHVHVHMCKHMHMHMHKHMHVHMHMHMKHVHVHVAHQVVDSGAPLVRCPRRVLVVDPREAAAHDDVEGVEAVRVPPLGRRRQGEQAHLVRVKGRVRVRVGARVRGSISWRASCRSKPSLGRTHGRASRTTRRASYRVIEG